MTEEKITKVEKEMEKKPEETKVEAKEEKKDVKVEAKKEDAKKTKKVEAKVHERAVANGFGLRISPKYSKYTCRMIRGKSVEAAIKRLQEVIDLKRPVPMAGLEVAHQKGKGLAGAKFPVNVCKGISEIVKQAGANAVANGVENGVIVIAKANQASAPYRRAGRKAKRCHIYIEVRDRVKLKEAKK